jgi:hypothetical protein
VFLRRDSDEHGKAIHWKFGSRPAAHIGGTLVLACAEKSFAPRGIRACVSLGSRRPALYLWWFPGSVGGFSLTPRLRD